MDVQNYTSYYYYVTSKYEWFESQPSAIVGTLIITAPETTTGFRAAYRVNELDQDEVFINWTAPENNGGSSILYYLVEREKSSVEGDLVNKKVLNITEFDPEKGDFIDEDIEQGFIYHYSLRAGNLLGESPAITTDPVYVPYGLKISNMKVETFVPSKVQFTFSLRNREDHSIILPSSYLKEHIHIFEDGNEIDYLETSLFLKNSENLKMEIILVLDFSASMEELEMIDTMMGSAFQFINQTPSSHRIGVVEYHDGSVEPSVIIKPTTNKEEIISSIITFSNSYFESGSSRSWDALDLAFDQFLPREEEYVRSVVFLSDGYDTSSKMNSNGILSKATNNDVTLYNIGFGNLVEDNEEILRSLSSQTGGLYYSANNIEEFEEQFDTVLRDLGGQYSLSYTTLRKTGSTEAMIQIGHLDDSPSFRTRLNLDTFAGDTRVGHLTIDKPEFEDDRVRFFIRARHVPRNINEIRFRVNTTLETTIELVGMDDGGICSGWTLTKSERNVYSIASEEPLEFGITGLIANGTISGIQLDKYMNISLEINNSIYPSFDEDNDGQADKRFEFDRSWIEIGKIILEPDYAAVPFLYAISEGPYIKLSWWEPEFKNPEVTGSVTGYVIYRKTQLGKWEALTNVGSKSSTFIDLDIVDGVTYSYYIIPVYNNNIDGASSPIQEVTSVYKETNDSEDEKFPYFLFVLLLIVIAVVILIFIVIRKVRSGKGKTTSGELQSDEGIDEKSGQYFEEEQGTPDGIEVDRIKDENDVIEPPDMSEVIEIDDDLDNWKTSKSFQFLGSSAKPFEKMEPPEMGEELFEGDEEKLFLPKSNEE
jgi:hypothetical protein